MVQTVATPALTATAFFTARLADRQSTLLTDEITVLRSAMRQAMQRYPFKIDAIAVLPSVIHTIWTLPKGDRNFSVRWRMIKSRFAKTLTENGAETRANAKLWLPQFWEHPILDRDDFQTHKQMVHDSPVQAGLCATALEWPHSSVHRKGPVEILHPYVNVARRPLVPKRARTYREEGFAHHP